MTFAREGTKAQLMEQVLRERACQQWGHPIRRGASRSLSQWPRGKLRPQAG